jgi:hypothetical protein
LLLASNYYLAEASIPKKSFTIPQSSWTDGGSDTEKERDKTKY